MSPNWLFLELFLESTDILLAGFSVFNGPHRVSSDYFSSNSEHFLSTFSEHSHSTWIPLHQRFSIFHLRGRVLSSSVRDHCRVLRWFIKGRLRCNLQWPANLQLIPPVSWSLESWRRDGLDRCQANYWGGLYKSPAFLSSLVEVRWDLNHQRPWVSFLKSVLLSLKVSVVCVRCEIDAHTRTYFPTTNPVP